MAKKIIGYILEDDSSNSGGGAGCGSVIAFFFFFVGWLSFLAMLAGGPAPAN
ncbi:MAG: hypothetical protein IKZ07_05700 [Akkermansia sp.]|nr:hypothetical protein [Akkermansia sp.]